MSERIADSIDYLRAAVHEIQHGRVVDTEMVVRIWNEFMTEMIKMYGQAIFFDQDTNQTGSGRLFELAPQPGDEDHYNTISSLGKILLGMPRPQKVDRTMLNKVDISLIERYLAYAERLNNIDLPTKELDAQS